METHQQHQDEKLDKLKERLDLLLARVMEIATQQQLPAQMDLNSQAVQQALRDQQLMVEQIEATGKGSCWSHLKVYGY